MGITVVSVSRVWHYPPERKTGDFGAPDDPGVSRSPAWNEEPDGGSRPMRTLSSQRLPSGHGPILPQSDFRPGPHLHSWGIIDLWRHGRRVAVAVSERTHPP